VWQWLLGTILQYRFGDGGGDGTSVWSELSSNGNNNSLYESMSTLSLLRSLFLSFVVTEFLYSTPVCKCNYVKCLTILLLLDILTLLLCSEQMYQTKWYFLHCTISHPFRLSCFVIFMSITDDFWEQMLHLLSFGWTSNVVIDMLFYYF